MTTALLPWHDTAFKVWHDLAQHAHAYLVIAPIETGGETFLQFLAASILCESPSVEHQPCGVCTSCELLKAFSHPDLRVLRPSILDVNHPIEELRPEKPSKIITIDDVRALSNMVNQTSHRGGTRVVLVYPAAKLNINAANALLKTLEEPPANTLFLLLADDVKQLLPTIVSRCQRITLPTPSTNTAIEHLTALHGTNPNWATWLAQENGAVERVATLSETKYFEWQNEFIQALTRGKSTNAMAIAETFEKRIKDADKARLAGEPLALDMATILNWLQRWTHDLLQLAQQSGQPRFYTQHAHIMVQLIAETTPSFIHRTHAWQQTLLNERRTSEHPLNLRTWLEKLLLQYTQLF